jgi:hypothetical protein
MIIWLVTLPIRLAFWLIGLVLWVLTLPLRLTFGILGLIGFGRILQLGALAAIGYFFYRLVSDTGDDAMDTVRIASEPTSSAELRSTPST